MHLKVPFINAPWSPAEQERRQALEDDGVPHCWQCGTTDPDVWIFVGVEDDPHGEHYYCDWKCAAISCAAISYEADDPAFEIGIDE